MGSEGIMKDEFRMLNNNFSCLLCLSWLKNSSVYSVYSVVKNGGAA